MWILIAWLKCLYARDIPYSCHPWWAFDRPFIVASSFCLSPCFSPSFASSLPHSTCSLSWTPSSMWTAPRDDQPLRLRLMRSIAPWRCTFLPQVMSPTSLTTSTTQRVVTWSSSRNLATKIRTHLCDAELDDETTRKNGYLHHCSFRSEKNQRTWDKPSHSYEESLLPAQSFFHTNERGDPCTNLVNVNDNQVAKWKTKESGFSLNDKKEQRLSEVRTEIQKHEFQADSDRECIQELNVIIESQRRGIDYTLARGEQLRRDQLLLHEQLSEQNLGPSWSSYKKSWWDGRIEASSRVKSRWVFEKKDWSKNPRHYQMNSRVVWIIREFRKILNQYAVDYPTLPVNQRYFHFFTILARCQSCPVGMLSRNDKPSDIWDTHGISGNVFL